MPGDVVQIEVNKKNMSFGLKKTFLNPVRIVACLPAEENIMFLQQVMMNRKLLDLMVDYLR